jgi:hypothetical protein
MELWVYPKIDATALFSRTGPRLTLWPAPQKCIELDRVGRKVRMRSWKSKHPFKPNLAVKISLLILGSMGFFALLIYESYVYAR